ncbi:hypothetical protein ACFPRL_10325 [Pseudoclavibacter helvolus]
MFSCLSHASTVRVRRRPVRGRWDFPPRQLVFLNVRSVSGRCRLSRPPPGAGSIRTAELGATSSAVLDAVGFGRATNPPPRAAASRPEWRSRSCSHRRRSRCR